MCNLPKRFPWRRAKLTRCGMEPLVRRINRADEKRRPPGLISSTVAGSGDVLSRFIVKAMFCPHANGLTHGCCPLTVGTSDTSANTFENFSLAGANGTRFLFRITKCAGQRTCYSKLDHSERWIVRLLQIHRVPGRAPDQSTTCCARCFRFIVYIARTLGEVGFARKTKNIWGKDAPLSGRR